MTATTPLLVACRACGARVLEVRWDYQQDTLIGEPRLDPIGLDHQQIVACIITGIRLWQIHEHARRHVTSRRTAWWPRKPVPGFTAPEHACGASWDALPISLAPEFTPIPDTCPF